MVQNLLTCKSNSTKSMCPDIRPVSVWAGAGMQQNSGRASGNPNIETRFNAGLLQMIHQKGNRASNTKAKFTYILNCISGKWKR